MSEFTRKVGEIFTTGGRRYQVAKEGDVDCCLGCAFDNQCCVLPGDVTGLCTQDKRSDKTGIIFKDLGLVKEVVPEAPKPRHGYRDVGSSFEYLGTTLFVVESKPLDGCHGCYFAPDKCVEPRAIAGPCYREGGNPVIFKKASAMQPKHHAPMAFTSKKIADELGKPFVATPQILHTYTKEEISHNMKSEEKRGIIEVGLGQTIEVNGATYVVKPNSDDSPCALCDFQIETCLTHFKQMGFCSASRRSDKTDVYFQKVQRSNKEWFEATRPIKDGFYFHKYTGAFDGLPYYTVVEIKGDVVEFIGEDNPSPISTGMYYGPIGIEEFKLLKDN